MTTLLSALLLFGATVHPQDRPESYKVPRDQLERALLREDYERAEAILRTVENVNLLGFGSMPMLTNFSSGSAQRGPEPVLMLLRHGADPNYGGRRAYRPLVCCADTGAVEIARILVQAGADVNLPGTKVTTPASITSRILEQAAANANLPESRLTTPLAASIESTWHKDRMPMMQYLLSAGARVDLPSRGGALPLQIAAYLGKPKFVTVLLDHGADINQRKEETLATALHAAVLENKPGNAEAVRLLLSRGAKANSRDSLGRTPYDIAKQKNFAELAALLPADPP